MTPFRRMIKQRFLGIPRPQGREVRTILVIRRNGIGDMICAFPVLRALKKAYPAARLTVLADPANAPIARCCEAVDEVLVFPIRRRLLPGRTWQVWRTARDLRHRHYDMAIGLTGSFSRLVAQLIYGSGAGYRAGTIPAERVAMPFYYTHYRVRNDRSRIHQILTGAEILHSMGIECDPNAIELPLPAGDVKWAKEWLNFRFDPARPLIWLHLSNPRPESRWEASRFRELAALLIEKTDANVVLAREPGDSNFEPVYFEPLPKTRVAWFEETSLMKFSAALSLARVVVCGDGGVMHLAAAVGTTVVALFSATEPEIWKPWGENHVVLRKGVEVNQIPITEVYEAIAKCLN